MAATGLGFASAPPAVPDIDGDRTVDQGRNWVALQIWDSIYPVPVDRSFPEHLIAFETVFQIYNRRLVDHEVRSAMAFGTNRNRFWTRSREGHFMLWVHLSDSFLARRRVDRRAFPAGAFLFPERENDLFIGWGGSANLVALLREGLRGLARPTPKTDGSGVEGAFHGFEVASAMGEADYEGGWYMDDEQASLLVDSVRTYPGLSRGYSFLRLASERPNAPYEPPGAELVNGYNCGDFAFYALANAGIVPREESEALKIRLSYPDAYLSRRLPLEGLGVREMEWLRGNPLTLTVPDGQLRSMAWQDLLFGRTGLEIFDEKAVVDTIERERPVTRYGRIWDQAHAIEWLKHRAEFSSKGVLSELAYYSRGTRRIPSPEPVRSDRGRFRFELSREARGYAASGREIERRKLERAGLTGEALEAVRSLQAGLSPEPLFAK